MVDVGDGAPEFTVPLADGDDVESFTLSNHLGDGPVVLAFFPGAFTGVCTHEMNQLQDSLSAFEAADATVYGVSVDPPFSLNEFHDALGIEFDLISDADGTVIDAYGVADDDFAGFGYTAAKRSVFVVDADGHVSYKWVTDDPGVEPDYDELEDAAAEA
jgi:peroxiredoxin